MSVQRLRRWPNIVQMLEKCFVFTGTFYINFSAATQFCSNTYMMLGILHGLRNNRSRTVLDVLLVLFQHLLLHTHTEVDPVSCNIVTLHSVISKILFYYL